MKYSAVDWEIAFKKLDLYKQLTNEYDVVYFDRKDFFSFRRSPTPRQFYGDSNFRNLTYFSAIPFYYLEWLQEINPDKIYDLGCGWNIFKKYYPNIIGVGPEDLEEGYYADIYDIVDDDYILGHQEYFECVFSINAFHFVPLSDIRKRALDFSSMIKPGGRGWFTCNADVMIKRDQKFKNADLNNIENFCKEQLSNIPSLVCLDIDLNIVDEYMDGNIQLQFSKEK